VKGRGDFQLAASAHLGVLRDLDEYEERLSDLLLCQQRRKNKIKIEQDVGITARVIATRYWVRRGKEKMLCGVEGWGWRKVRSK
jgi:hypothetical protein